MKCLPNCQNIDFSDTRFRQFWERMVEARLPLLAHTGGEHTLPVINAALADPRSLRFPLECGVTVIAAHCGTRSGVFDRDCFDVWAQLLREFPNLYGDISAMVSPNRCGHLRDCLRDEIAPRILHGSDFPVPVLGHRIWLQGWIDRATFRALPKDPQPARRRLAVQAGVRVRGRHRDASRKSAPQTRGVTQARHSEFGCEANQGAAVYKPPFN